MVEVDFAKIEKKWQGKWEREKVFEVKDSGKDKYYVLEMFPYPSGSGLHMGHAWNYTIGDILARFKMMQGFNVLHPMGFDSLGLPAENAAIEKGEHPEDYTKRSVANFAKQFKSLGISYDWSRVLNTSDPSYYKWDQWIFLKMLEKGLAYQKESEVNWCKKCNTVLANEQVHDGKCWRHDEVEVEVRQLKQWFLKTTEYADELYSNLENMDWPERTKAMQRNWIGKSHGVEIDFEVIDVKDFEFVFLHAYGDNPRSSFWTSLKKEIESRGGKVVYAPDLPGGDSPKIDEQIDFVLKNYKFKENTVLITHSLGGTLALKLLPKLKTKIARLVMIAPPAKYEPKDKIDRPLLKACCDWNFDYSEVKKKVRKIEVLSCTNDHIVPLNHGNELAEKLDALLVEAEGVETHFNGSKELAVEDIVLNKWSIFTTRPDTIFGVTFMVVSAAHARLDGLVTDEQRKDVDKFLKKIKCAKDVDKLDKEGVFSGSYAINPANGEKVPVWIGNFVVADYGCGMVMAVPAHDQRDFEFAKKYGIEIRQVVAPLFVNNTADDSFREDKKTIERNAICALVKHWKDDKYFCLDWKKMGWKTPVIGGIDKGESAEDAVIREVKEETGYQDIKGVKKISIETHASFFARHKDVNRYGRFNTYIVELGSGKFSEPEEEHVKNHVGVWIDKKDIKKFFNLQTHSYAWENYLKGEGAFTGEGVLINSGEFDKANNDTAKDEIVKWLKKKKVARKVVNFKLRDWGVSRQRYWGTPIPIIHCEKCGAVAVPEKDLPVKLPKDVKFGKGNPLETNEKWLSVKCPKCSGKGLRESDTMDTFVNSSWYFLRYCDPNNAKKIFDAKKVRHWCPVDTYIGGAEHACMHLIYSRFYVKFLRDIGLIDFDEPAVKLFHQGILHGENGEKMSKSKGNGVLPEEVSSKYGIDTARFFLSGIASPDKDIDWSEKGINGSLRFVKKVIDLYSGVKIGKDSDEVLSKLNETVKNVGAQIDVFDYRAATIRLKELFDLLAKQKEVSKATLESALKMLAPFCPHVAEELWEKMSGNGFISVAGWPKVDEKKIVKKGQGGDLNEKIVEDVKRILEKVGDAKKVYVYVMPFELEKVDVKKIEKVVGKSVEVFAVNDSGKHDPEGKAKRAKPGKASVYVE